MVRCLSDKSQHTFLLVAIFFMAVIGTNLHKVGEKKSTTGILVFEYYTDIRKENPGSVQVSAETPSEKVSREDEIRRLANTLRASYQMGEIRAVKFASWILEAHTKSGVPVGHIAALLATESSFRYQARSHVGAIGPAQVVPRFWSEFCKGSLKEPGANVLCGARVLAHYRKTCPDWRCAFQKYNVGPRGYIDPENAEAIKRYIAKIQSHQAELEAASVIN